MGGSLGSQRCKNKPCYELHVMSTFIVELGSQIPLDTGQRDVACARSRFPHVITEILTDSALCIVNPFSTC